MSMSEWVKNQCDEASIAYPSKSKIYDKAHWVYCAMGDDHSGMSWSITRNTVHLLYNQMDKKLLNDKEKACKWVKDWIKSKITKETDEDKENDGFSMLGYVVNIYHCAEYVMSQLITISDTEEEYDEVFNCYNRLANGSPLLPITNDDENWNLCNEDEFSKEYQCKKMSSLFKTVYMNGYTTYHDLHRAYCSETKIDAEGKEYEDTYNGGISKIVDMLYPITMPYMPSDGKYKLNVKNFMWDGNEYVLVKSIVEPDKNERKTMMPFVLTSYGKDKEGFDKVAFAHISYTEYLKAYKAYKDKRNEDFAKATEKATEQDKTNETPESCDGECEG